MNVLMFSSFHEGGTRRGMATKSNFLQWTEKGVQHNTSSNFRKWLMNTTKCRNWRIYVNCVKSYRGILTTRRMDWYSPSDLREKKISIFGRKIPEDNSEAFQLLILTALKCYAFNFIQTWSIYGEDTKRISIWLIQTKLYANGLRIQFKPLFAHDCTLYREKTARKHFYL